MAENQKGVRKCDLCSNDAVRGLRYCHTHKQAIHKNMVADGYLTRVVPQEMSRPVESVPEVYDPVVHGMVRAMVERAELSGNLTGCVAV